MNDSNLVEELRLFIESRQTGEEVPGVTIWELMEATGLSRGKLQTILKLECMAGRIKATQTTRPNIIGTPSLAVVYSLPNGNTETT